MKFVYEALLGLHWLGLFAIGYGLFAKGNTQTRGINAAMLHGVSTQLLTGALMVGMREGNVLADEDALNTGYVSIKLLVALVMLGVIVKGRRTTGDTRTLWLAVGGLWLLNLVLGGLLAG